MTEEAQPKSRGRPPKFAGERTRGSLTIRLRDRVRDEVQHAATRYGRSLSEEIEDRLELSIAKKDQLTFEWGDDFMAIATAMASALARLEDLYGRKWHSDTETAELFKITAGQIIQNYHDHVKKIGSARPKGSVNLLEMPPVEQARWFAGLAGMPAPRIRSAPVQALITDTDDADEQALPTAAAKTKSRRKP